MLDRFKCLEKFRVAPAKALASGALAFGGAAAVVMTPVDAMAALDMVALQAAIDTNLGVFESVGASLMMFVLGVAVYKGLIAWFRASGKG
ncbi:MAG: hypothetical protein HQL69_19370 [Magnetococcales bacterium]|nr:hypothetical protein [Magnetococcales bacterium]